MAALGTIRKRGVILVCIISFGLFAFIAEEAFRSCDSAKNNERQQIGEVYGEKISVQDFQKLVDEYTEVIKMQQGQENLPEEQMNQVKDMVWNTYVQNQIIAKEAEQVGSYRYRRRASGHLEDRYKPNASADSIRKSADRSFRCICSPEVPG